MFIWGNSDFQPQLPHTHRGPQNGPARFGAKVPFFGPGLWSQGAGELQDPRKVGLFSRKGVQSTAFSARISDHPGDSRCLEPKHLKIAKNHHLQAPRVSTVVNAPTGCPKSYQDFDKNLTKMRQNCGSRIFQAKRCHGDKGTNPNHRRPWGNGSRSPQR